MCSILNLFPLNPDYKKFPRAFVHPGGLQVPEIPARPRSLWGHGRTRRPQGLWQKPDVSHTLRVLSSSSVRKLCARSSFSLCCSPPRHRLHEVKGDPLLSGGCGGRPDSLSSGQGCGGGSPSSAGRRALGTLKLLQPQALSLPSASARLAAKGLPAPASWPTEGVEPAEARDRSAGPG